MTVVTIQGMRCQHCVQSVTKALEAIEGITELRVDLATGEARYEEKKTVDPAVVKKAIQAIGFEIS